MPARDRSIINITPQRCIRCGNTWVHSTVHIAALDGRFLGAALWHGEPIEPYCTHTARHEAIHVGCFRCTIDLPALENTVTTPTKRPVAANPYDDATLDDLLKL